MTLPYKEYQQNDKLKFAILATDGFTLHYCGAVV